MNKRRDLIKLAGWFFAALLVLAVVLFVVVTILIKQLRPPFSATTPEAISPSPEAIVQPSTGTLNQAQPSPTINIPSPTHTAAIPQDQTWKQGRLAYLVRTTSGFNSIYMLDLETDSKPRLLLQPTTNQHYYGPWLSPDANKLVFYDINGSNGILNLQDLSVTLMDSCNSPTYSPGGDQIICGAGGHFRILDANNGELLRTLEAGVNGWLPVFSPDGTQVAFAVFGSGNSTSIWRIDAAGGRPLTLATGPFENYCPSWSPDGNWIAYQSGAEKAGSEIWIMDRYGGNKRQITSSAGGWSRGPVWSPDGKWLAYVAAPAGTTSVEYGEIIVISVASGETHQVTDSGRAVDNWRVSWGPSH